jgi:hypothetical protein
MTGPNPAGLRALDLHRHKAYFGSPALRQCKSKSRRTGEPCRATAMRGKNVCRHHGGHSNGRGVKKPPEQRNGRQQQNFSIRCARLEAKRALKIRDLHPDTMPVFRQQYAGKIAPSNIFLFLMALDNRLQGNLDGREWQDALVTLASP